MTAGAILANPNNKPDSLKGKPAFYTNNLFSTAPVIIGKIFLSYIDLHRLVSSQEI